MTQFLGLQQLVHQNEKPLVAAGVESGSGGTNQGLFNLPAPSLCPPALLPC